MLQGEHSAILTTFIKLPFVFKTLVLSIYEWPLKTGFTVLVNIESATIIKVCNNNKFLMLQPEFVKSCPKSLLKMA